ncbi:MAG: putative Ig domain-containing protein [Thermoplasmatota archaeon]
MISITGFMTLIQPVESTNMTIRLENEVSISEKSGNGYFTENLGQWDEDLYFVGDAGFGRIGIGSSSIYFDLEGVETVSNIVPMIQDDISPGPKGNIVKYTFENANQVVPSGTGQLRHVNNYILGNNPDGWVSGARNFESVSFMNIYDGIDLQYYFTEKGPKYDLILEPYAEPDDIRIKVEGHRSIDIIGNGIEIEVADGVSIIDTELISYDQDDLKLIGSEFKMVGENTYGFELGDYDRADNIVIDPVIFSTYLGGSDNELLTPDMIEDSAGYPIICLRTPSSDFPTTPGSYDTTLEGIGDIVATKLTDDGSDLIYSTFIGGAGSEFPYRLLIDENDDLVILGYTSSADFPLSTGAYQATLSGVSDLFVFRLNNEGSGMISSTLIGGTSTDTFSGFVSLGSNGNLVAATSLISTMSDFPTTSGAFDTVHSGTNEGCIFEIKADGTDLVFSTFFGGSSTETVRSMDIRPNGEIWVSGTTQSGDFPVSSDAYDGGHNGGSDVYFLKMKSDGSDIVYSTYIGDTGTDVLYDCLVDESGAIFLAGYTSSLNFPTTLGPSNQGGEDIFVMKMKSDGSGFHYSRLIGGTDHDYSPYMELKNGGEVVIRGISYSSDFPITPGAFDSTFGPAASEYVIFVLEVDGSDLISSTFFGGSANEIATLLLGPNDEILLAGSSNSTDYPTTSDAEYSTNQGNRDLFFTHFYEDLTDLEYSTYYGGSMSEYGTPYYNSATGNLYLAGYTYSSDFPTSDGAFDDTLDGTNDNVIVRVAEILDQEPLEVYSVRTYSDDSYLVEASSFDRSQKVNIELRGLDSNNSRKGNARINITFGISQLTQVSTRLKETDINTGIYHGSFLVPPGVLYTDTMTFYSRKDTTKFARIFIEPPFRPTSVSDLGIFSDPICIVPADKLDKGDTGYIKITGADSNPGSVNKALANVTGITNRSIHIPIVLDETESSTGVYIGSFVVPSDNGYFENFTVYSVRNEAVKDTFMVHTPVQIRPLADRTKAREDEEYRSPDYWNFGYETATWSTSFIAPWLNWDEENKEFYGTPNNNHVGPWDVHVEISDGKGHLDSHDFQIMVQNTPPNITTANVLFATEGIEYNVDYNSSDDGQGQVTWSVIPDNSWFSINANNGILSGIPRNEDIGNINLTVFVKDSHDGTSSSSFMLTVIGVNDPPTITSLDIKTGKQGENYYRKYEAHDPDGDTKLTWTLRTDAEFLTMESDTGVLHGIPGKYDVGDFLVNITVTDPSGANSSREFILSIENVNDMPEWVDVPMDLEIIHGQWFRFDVNATDPDPEGFIEYSVQTDPETDMEIDEISGELEWLASVLPFSTTTYELEVTIKASDGVLFNRYDFVITVIPTEPPISTIWGPADGEKVASQGAVLEWEGTDPEEEALTFDIYLHENQAFVAGFREEAVYLTDYSGTSLTLNDLDQGKTYYWLVIPYDGGTHGSCESGVRSFKVNYRPVVQSVSQQEAKTGSEFSLKISASDGDAEDSGNLIYTLTEAPTGMTIKEETGVIKWKPSSSQEGYHMVTVEVSDGVETVTETFDIEVLKGEEAGLPIGLIAGIGVALAIIILVVILFFVFRKKSGEKELDEEEERIKMEMERHQKEKEWEAEHMKPHIPDNQTSSVPLSATEAHAHDKDGIYDQPDYEDLYGQPAPEVEEGEVTTEELRDHIREAVNNIEQMDTPEEGDDFLDELVSKMPKSNQDKEMLEE